MNPAALGRLRAVMSSLRRAGKIVSRPGQSIRRVQKSFGRVAGASGEATRIKSINLAAKSRGWSTGPTNTRAENVMNKLTKARPRMHTATRRTLGLGIGGAAVGYIAHKRRQRRLAQEQQQYEYVRRTY